MSYSIQDIVSWYQKKIGTYDKQQWEKTVEQRILSGLTHVPMRTAKLKTEFIDVDLVRGSAFTKTKPKHGWLKVTNLATLRLLLLPFYYNWWISQTSTHIFCLLLALYSLQLISTALFAYVCLINDPTNTLGNISASEVLAPIAMMLVLSITHSQIVSTHATAGSKKNDHQRNSVAAGSAACRRIKRTKRRSTCVRSRPSHDYSSDSKLPCDIPIDKSNEPNETKYNSKRSRVKSDMPENSPRNRNCRNVVWDTTPVKINQRSRMYKDREDNGSSSLVNNCAINQQVEKFRRLSASDIRQIGGVDRMQVPETEEQEPTSPSLDDDGFESLDGSGSSDGIQEDKDISLSAAEYESVAKIQGSPSHIINLNLVSNSFCPPIKNLHFKSNGSLDSNKCNEDVNNRIEIDNDNSSAKSNNNHAVTDKHPLISSTLDERIRSYESNEDLDDTADVNSKTACCRHRQQIHSKNRLAGVAKRTLESGPPINLKVNEDVETDDSETESVTDQCVSKILLPRSVKGQSNISNKPDKIMAESSVNSSGDESEVEGALSSPGSFCPLLTEGTTSAGEWIGVTTNSEECSYSSEIDGSDNQYEQQFTLTSDNNEHPFEWELDMIPNVILNPTNTASGKVSCTMWEKKEVKKANLSVLDISSAIIARVEAMPENMDYLYIGVVMSVLLAFLPSAYRLTESLYEVKNLTGSLDDKMLSINLLLPDSGCPVFVENLLRILSNGVTMLHTAFGVSVIGNIVIIIAIIERFCLATIFFFLLTVAERTFKQRFLYAKFFSHLTSFRRARKSELPHFRLNKVRNIKTWLSVRSYLKKRGPQRSVDVIVSSAFLTAVLLISFLSVELLKDSEYNVEVLGWCIVIGFFILRFMTLGTKINRKYRNLSTIITEQINLYLQIEQKPNKKEELMVANSVLKLAADLLKELESPFKISGFSANPYLYTVTKVVMLSALSGILSEILGFKLKLHKIKIK